MTLPDLFVAMLGLSLIVCYVFSWILAITFRDGSPGLVSLAFIFLLIFPPIGMAASFGLAIMTLKHRHETHVHWR